MNETLNRTLNCTYVGKCGGCAWGERDLATVAQDKSSAVRALFPAVQMVPAPTLRVRDRADLVWEKSPTGEMKLGLYGLHEREVVDLASCPMMSEPLEAWLQDFRRKAPDITRGSVRLRVAPDGERGVWLDFANQDVKKLFGERAYLEWLSAQAFVEIGQRRKALVWRDGAPKLVEPVLRPWFETYGADLKPIPLYGPVGGFSQSGFVANRALVGAVSEMASATGVKDWLELFCGNGNFALALAARGLTVEAVELEELALRGLEMSLQESNLSVKIQRADVYLKTEALPAVRGRGLLVDPPRAGLRQVLVHLENGWRPQYLIYVSCFTDVFLQDTARLQALGYELKNVKGVDQFPYTPHGEWVALFEDAPY